MDTNEWCAREREKVDLAYQQLEEATVRMRVMHPEQERDILSINCGGKDFTVPKSPPALHDEKRPKHSETLRNRPRTP